MDFIVKDKVMVYEYKYTEHLQMKTNLFHCYKSKYFMQMRISNHEGRMFIETVNLPPGIANYQMSEITGYAGM